MPYDNSVKKKNNFLAQLEVDPPFILLFYDFQPIQIKAQSHSDFQ
jgi:hypothetical protein